MRIQVNFADKKGTFKALQGVNNGPVCYGTTVDVSHYYRELAMPWVRLHDPNWPNPLEVDIHTIFPNFHADAENPDNYDFDRTDIYLQSILDTGAKIVYRLGESIEHGKRRYCTPPEDSKQWAAICRGIVKHYNHGWANGFHYNIQYWEVWNEVENAKMWDGTAEQYYELYRAASTALRELDPELKIGGYSCGGGVFNSLTYGFLEYIKEHNLPFDFLSWHAYPRNPQTAISMGLRVRAMLDEYGFHEAESHFNEWNYMPFPPGENWKTMWKNEYVKQDMFERGKSAEGASFAAAMLIGLQDAHVDVANYYDGQPTSIFCGLFNYYGVPQKPFYAFKALRELYDTGTRVAHEWEQGRDGLYVDAAVNEGKERGMVVLSNFSEQDQEILLHLNQLPSEPWIVERYVLDETRNLTLAGVNMENMLRLRLPAYTVTQLKLIKV